MIWAHAHLGGQITEHMILLMIFSTHAFSYHGRLWICSIFPQPASTTVLLKGSSTKRTTRELPQQNSGNGLSKSGDGPGVMPLHAHRANPEDGNGVAARRRVSPRGRRERRGKNGSVRPPRTHRPQGRGERDGENRASLVLHNVPVRVLASVPGSRARRSNDVWPIAPDLEAACFRAEWRASTWSVRLPRWATR